MFWRYTISRDDTKYLIIENEKYCNLAVHVYPLVKLLSAKGVGKPQIKQVNLGRPTRGM